MEKSHHYYARQIFNKATLRDGRHDSHWNCTQVVSGSHSGAGFGVGSLARATPPVSRNNHSPSTILFSERCRLTHTRNENTSLSCRRNIDQWGRGGNRCKKVRLGYIKRNYLTSIRHLFYRIWRFSSISRNMKKNKSINALIKQMLLKYQLAFSIISLSLSFLTCKVASYTFQAVISMTQLNSKNSIYHWWRLKTI